MAVYDILPNEDLRDVDVVATLNANGGIVDFEQESWFKLSANVNKWSKFKPICHSSLFLDGDGRWRGENGLCGFTEESILFNDVSTLVNAYESKGTFVYRLPKGDFEGTPEEPFRIGDFRGYNAKAAAPIWDFYVNGAFQSGENNSTIDCELVDNHSGIDASYNLVLGDIRPGGFNAAYWYFGCIIVANDKYFKKSHSSSLGSDSTIANKLFTVSYSDVANVCGVFSKYKVYPCLFQYANGNSGLVMAVPCAAGGGSFSGGIQGEVVQQQSAVAWVGNTYCYTFGFLSFKGVLGYPKTLDGYNASITINVYNNGSVRQSYSTNTYKLEHTEETDTFCRMDFSYETRWNYQAGDSFEMIVSGGSNNIESKSTPIVINDVVAPIHLL